MRELDLNGVPIEPDKTSNSNKNYDKNLDLKSTVLFYPDYEQTLSYAISISFASLEGKIIIVINNNAPFSNPYILNYVCFRGFIYFIFFFFFFLYLFFADQNQIEAYEIVFERNDDDDDEVTNESSRLSSSSSLPSCVQIMPVVDGSSMKNFKVSKQQQQQHVMTHY